MPLISKNHLYRTHAQRGLTLIEVMVSLSIFALILSGALALYNTTSNSATATRLKTDISALRAATQKLGIGLGNYGTAGENLNFALVNAKQVPESMGSVIGANNTATITNYSTNTPVRVEASNPVSLATFDIIVGSGLPKEICIAVVVGSNGWKNVAVAPDSGSWFDLTQPVSITSASSACSGAGDALKFTSH